MTLYRYTVALQVDSEHDDIREVVSNEMFRILKEDIHDRSGLPFQEKSDGLFDYTLELSSFAETPEQLELSIREVLAMRINNETLSSLVLTGAASERPFTIYFLCIPSQVFEVFEFKWPVSTNPDTA